MHMYSSVKPSETVSGCGVEVRFSFSGYVKIGYPNFLCFVCENCICNSQDPNCSANHIVYYHGYLLMCKVTHVGLPEKPIILT